MRDVFLVLILLGVVCTGSIAQVAYLDARLKCPSARFFDELDMYLFVSDSADPFIVVAERFPAEGAKSADTSLTPSLQPGQLYHLTLVPLLELPTFPGPERFHRGPTSWEIDGGELWTNDPLSQARVIIQREKCFFALNIQAGRNTEDRILRSQYLTPPASSDTAKKVCEALTSQTPVIGSIPLLGPTGILSLHSRARLMQIDSLWTLVRTAGRLLLPRILDELDEPSSDSLAEHLTIVADISADSSSLQALVAHILLGRDPAIPPWQLVLMHSLALKDLAGTRPVDPLILPLLLENLVRLDSTSIGPGFRREACGKMALKCFLALTRKELGGLYVASYEPGELRGYFDNWLRRNLSKLCWSSSCTSFFLRRW